MTSSAQPRTTGSGRNGTGGTPRLGFAGTGSVGTRRMRSIAEAGVGQIVCIADVSIDAACRARDVLGARGADVRTVSSLDAMFAEELDGVVIATPNALHVDQVLAVLRRGMSVFCQRPLARTAADCALVVDTARRQNRLLGIDFSYRAILGVDSMRDMVVTGSLGDIHAVDLTFHQASGPSSAWLYDAAQSGGGCAIDLGTHLIDLLLYVLDHPAVETVSSRLYAHGQLLPARSTRVEDHALATIVLTGGAVVRLACSWKSNAGTDAVIDATFTGTRGAVRLRNVDGSPNDFAVDHLVGSATKRLASPPDDWEGRAAVQWARALGRSAAFDGSAQTFVDVSRIVDRIYGR